MEKKVGKDLIIHEKENIFKLFFKWVSQIFHKEEMEYTPENVSLLLLSIFFSSV